MINQLGSDRMIAAIQKRHRFAPGEFIVVRVESESVGSRRRRYRVIDAAVGIVERGSWAVAEQPWLPDGPIATDVIYPMPGYGRVGNEAAPAQEVQVIP
jgi:hypothetical protein